MGMRSEHDAGYSARRTFTVLQITVRLLFFCLLSLQAGESALVPDGDAIDNHLGSHWLMRKPRSVSDQNPPPQFPVSAPPPIYGHIRGAHPPWAPKSPTAVPLPRPPTPPCCRDPNHPLPPPSSRGPPPPPFPHPPPPFSRRPPPAPFPRPPRTIFQDPPPPTISIAPLSIRAPMTPPTRAPMTTPSPD